MTADDHPFAANSTLRVRRSYITRSPLSPGQPLKGAHLGRFTGDEGGTVTRLRPRPSPSVAAFSPDVRRLIRLRARDACEACGTYLESGRAELQHRVARGMGGSSDPLLGSPANGVLLCLRCHAVAESRDGASHEEGFWLLRHEDPRLVPILLHGSDGGTLVWLAMDGTYSCDPPAGSAA